MICNVKCYSKVKDTIPEPPSAPEDPVRQFFLKLAGPDEEVDWLELKEILDYAMRSGQYLIFSIALVFSHLVFFFHRNYQLNLTLTIYSFFFINMNQCRSFLCAFYYNIIY